LSSTLFVLREWWRVSAQERRAKADAYTPPTVQGAQV
jgi:hypothetical protein